LTTLKLEVERERSRKTVGQTIDFRYLEINEKFMNLILEEVVAPIDPCTTY
jgi:hypothetical protein